MANKLYKEKQRFNDKLVLVMLGLGIVGLLYAAATFFFNEQTSATYALTCLAFAAGLGGILYRLTHLRYKLQVTDKQIKFKLSPAQVATQKIKWAEVDSCEIVKTPKAAQWHGSNLRRPREKYFSLTGRNGMAITTKCGSRYFLGCTDVEALKDTLSSATLRKVQG